MKGDASRPGLKDIASGRLLALDIEGTGTNPHLPVEIAILTVDAGIVIDRRHWLINPGTPISPYATRIHGLTDEDVRDAPGLAEIAPQVRAVMAGETLVGHAIQQDLDILRNLIPDVDFLPGRMLDTLRLSKSLLPGLPGYRLELVMETLGLDWNAFEDPKGRSGKHTAPGDAEAAARVFLSLVQRVPAKQMAHFARMATITMSAERERRLREALEGRGEIAIPVVDGTSARQ